MDTTRWTTFFRTLCGAAVMSLALWYSGATSAQDHHPPASQELRGRQEHREMLSASGFFPAGVIQGEWVGTLYCLRHDFSGSEADKAICQQEGRHVHVLVMERGYIHPLYGVDDAVHAQIHGDELHGKTVKMQGKFYPVSNSILVSTVTPQ